MPRSEHKHWLIGSATSVLRAEFITEFTKDSSMDVTASLPFSGPIQLPTKMQALKLFWFIRDTIGRMNSCNLTNGQIQGIVAKVIGHYWSMAGYDTVTHSTAVRQVKRIVDQHQKLLKSQSRTQPKAVRDRDAFLADLKICLDIGETGLREFLIHGLS